MKFERLQGNEKQPFTIDMVSWPNCNGLLYHLEKVAGINVLAKSSWFLSGDYFADFEYQGYRFEIETPLSTPWLSATEGCPEEVFEELLRYVNSYSHLKPLIGFIGFFRYLRLPAVANKSLDTERG